jgi:alkylhydroperoxidase/carboxymuconolactone decarboxylase family protein YurZ
MEEGGKVADSFSDFVSSLDEHPHPDKKTKHLIYIGVQTALGNGDAVGAHIPIAMKEGATEEEIFGSMLVTVPASGMNGLMACLPALRKTLLRISTYR